MTRRNLHLSSEDRIAFDRWMRANAVVGSIFAVALLIMAFVSPMAPEPGRAAAVGTSGIEVSASVQHGH